MVGGGIGGLAAALDLAQQGHRVTLVERAAAPGGKMRQIGGIDAGPTVFTMRWVFEEIFADAGTRLEDHLTLRPATVLARHAWSGTERLDLFADMERSAAAIEAFAGPAEARGFRDFCREARRTYDVLEQPFIRAPRPSMLSLTSGVGNLGDLLAIRPFQTLWAELARHLGDARLRQLFGRYATYCGSSPFLAPATLMLVAHVEQQGVWFVDGGMHRVAAALAGLAVSRGTVIRYAAEASEILVGKGRACGVRLASGETLSADAVVLNADPAALAAGLFGRAAASAIPALPPAQRSLSALTWAGEAETAGFPLVRHNVFFSHDYRAEFDTVGQGKLPAEPTVYVCAQDRADADAPLRSDRLLILVNAPPVGDQRHFTAAEIEQCRQRAFDVMQHCGLTIRSHALTPTSPADFHRLFPGTGGALYGPAVHGAMASFRRPGSRTGLKGLYLAGGSTHPGAGVPMAALSGRLAASALMADLGSTRQSRITVTSGGMSTR